MLVLCLSDSNSRKHLLGGIGADHLGQTLLLIVEVVILLITRNKTQIVGLALFLFAIGRIGLLVRSRGAMSLSATIGVVGMAIATATSVTTKRRPMTRVARVVHSSTSMARRASSGRSIVDRMRGRHVSAWRGIRRVRSRSVLRRVRGAIRRCSIGGRSWRRRRRAVKSHSDWRSHHLTLWSRMIPRASSTSVVVAAVRHLRV